MFRYTSGDTSMAERLAHDAFDNLCKGKREEGLRLYAEAAESAYTSFRHTLVNHMSDRIRIAFLVIEYFVKAGQKAKALEKIEEFLALKSFNASTKVLLDEEKKKIQ